MCLTGNRKDWFCPHCPQTSSRHWNLEIHIKRKHDGIGHPIETGLASNTGISGQIAQDRMNFVYSFPSSVGPKKEGLQKRVAFDNLLQTIRKLLKSCENGLFQDFARRISPSSSRQPITMSDVLMAQWLSSFSIPNISQNNTNTTTNNKSVAIVDNLLPMGYGVLSCNRCLADNWLQVIFTSVETESLTKVIHLCDLEVVASKENDQSVRNSQILIKERQNNIIVRFRKAVDLRIRLDEEQGGDVSLKVQESGNYQSVLPYMRNIKLPPHKLWNNKHIINN